MILQIAVASDSVVAILTNSGASIGFVIGIAFIMLLFFVLFLIVRADKSPVSPQKEIEQPAVEPARNRQQTGSNTVSGSPIEHGRQGGGATVLPGLIGLPAAELKGNTTTAKSKYIGYQPTNIFAQTEPVNFPYVLMPSEAGCVIQFPRKGRASRQGHQEARFFTYLQEHFQQVFGLYNDRLLLVRSTNQYEPDFILTDEVNGLNLFLDIEIDEPYTGTNELAARQPTHYQLADANRNNDFCSRGWVVVRFAEIQVHQHPLSCCLFIADVIASLNPKFERPKALVSVPYLPVIPQWTKKQAQEWAQNGYREKYLGIPFREFGEFKIPSISQEKVTETEAEKRVEIQVNEKPVISTQPKTFARLITASDLINEAIKTSCFLSFQYEGRPTVVKPTRFNLATRKFTAFCYVKNAIREFIVDKASSILAKPKFYTAQLAKPELTADTVRALIQIAIRNNKYVRIIYTTSSYGGATPETTTRTINNVYGVEDAVPAEERAKYGNMTSRNIIHAHCHNKDAGRNFHYDRISEIAILDL